MLAALALAGLLWSTLALAQDDLGQLPTCAAGCVQAVAQANSCTLATAQCLCPHELAIHQCISRACPISDLAKSNTLIGSFCLGGTLPDPTSPPVVTPPPTTPTLATSPPPGRPPITTESQPPGGIPPPVSSPSLPILSPPIPTTTSDSTTSLELPTTESPLPITTSAGPPTVTVFSTQFAPPAPFNGALSTSTFVREKSGMVLVLTMALSGIVGTLMV